MVGAPAFRDVGLLNAPHALTIAGLYPFPVLRFRSTGEKFQGNTSRSCQELERHVVSRCVVFNAQDFPVGTFMFTHTSSAQRSKTSNDCWNAAKTEKEEACTAHRYFVFSILASRCERTFPTFPRNSLRGELYGKPARICSHDPASCSIRSLLRGFSSHESRTSTASKVSMILSRPFASSWFPPCILMPFQLLMFSWPASICVIPRLRRNFPN